MIINSNDNVATDEENADMHEQSLELNSDTNSENSTRNVTKNKAVSVSSAGIRAVLYQMQALYLRTPVKLFRPSRFDYLAYVRELANLHDNIYLKPYSFRTHSSIGMLFNVFRKEGWRFIPDQVLPPLIANSATGVILYGTYLSSLDRFDHNRKQGAKPNKSGERSYSYLDTWKAGFIAGAIQSLAAAPIDAIYARSSAAEVLSQKHVSLWSYGLQKLKEIGLIGVFAGYGFSLIKESLGFAFYFSTFEFVKTQGYSSTYATITYYRTVKDNIKSIFGISPAIVSPIEKKELIKEEKRSIRFLKSTFVLIAGASAAFTLLAIQYPLSKVQKIHLGRLEAMDIYNSYKTPISHPLIKLYYNSYIDTYHQLLKIKKKSGTTWFKISYKGFVKNAITTIPVTSVGLLAFEIMRTRLTEDFIDSEVLEA